MLVVSLDLAARPRVCRDMSIQAFDQLTRGQKAFLYPFTYITPREEWVLNRKAKVN